jgi:hypothetical protein
MEPNNNVNSVGGMCTVRAGGRLDPNTLKGSRICFRVENTVSIRMALAKIGNGEMFKLAILH